MLDRLYVILKGRESGSIVKSDLKEIATLRTERKREIESLKLWNRKQEAARMNDKDKENKIRYIVKLSVETLKTCAKEQTTLEQRERAMRIFCLRENYTSRVKGMKGKSDGGKARVSRGLLDSVNCSL